jgi:hypothetical protein
MGLHRMIGEVFLVGIQCTGVHQGGCLSFILWLLKLLVALYWYRFSVFRSIRSCIPLQFGKASKSHLRWMFLESVEIFFVSLQEYVVVNFRCEKVHVCCHLKPYGNLTTVHRSVRFTDRQKWGCINLSLRYRRWQRVLEPLMYGFSEVIAHDSGSDGHFLQWSVG